MCAAKAVLLPQATWSGTHSILQFGAEVKPQFPLTVSSLGSDCLRQYLPHKLYAVPPAVPSFSEDTTMWQVCFAVFVIPTAIVTAMGLLHILVYGGESTDARG